MKINNFFLYLILLLIGISINSCYEHEEGCRDINALNFDVEADKNCEDECCKYPEVKLSFNFMVDTIKIDTNYHFSNEINDSLRIKFLRIYLSDFSLINNSDTLDIVNSVKTGIEKNDKTEYSNINYSSAKVKPESSTYTLGILEKLKNFNEVDFSFGLDSEINHTILDKVSLSSPLHQASDSMYINKESGFYFLKLDIEASSGEVRQFYISGDENLTNIALRGNIDFTERENHYLKINMDLLKWFSNIDFKTNDEIQIKHQLIENIANSFVLKND